VQKLSAPVYSCTNGLWGCPLKCKICA